MSDSLPSLPEGYDDFLKMVKNRIQTAQVRAAFAVSRELVALYWRMGRDIAEKQERHGWGDKILDRLAADLQNAFPGVEGFSRRNLYRMRVYYRAYPNESEFVTQAVSQIPWSHNIVIFQKVKETAERLWYAQQTLEYGWSRAILEMQIESGLYHRQGKAITNFERTLPPPQSDLAQQVLKNPYNFDFLTLLPDALERDAERGLLDHIRRFLLELGAGFAFVGSQVPLEVGESEFAVDLLFYHLKLRCYVVIDLKMGKFEPEFAGKMNFYLSAADDLLRHPDDKPSIGVILCKTRDRVIAEYALRDINKPIGVSEFLHTVVLPDDLKRHLPAIAELEAELRALPDVEEDAE